MFVNAKCRSIRVVQEKGKRLQKKIFFGQEGKSYDYLTFDFRRGTVFDNGFELFIENFHHEKIDLLYFKHSIFHFLCKLSSDYRSGRSVQKIK